MKNLHFPGLKVPGFDLPLTLEQKERNLDKGIGGGQAPIVLSQGRPGLNETAVKIIRERQE